MNLHAFYIKVYGNLFHLVKYYVCVDVDPCGLAPPDHVRQVVPRPAPRLELVRDGLVSDPPLVSKSRHVVGGRGDLFGEKK